MLFLENNTTFSGSDIKVYVYRHIDDFKNLMSDRNSTGARVNIDELLENTDLDKMDEVLDSVYQKANIASGSGKYVDGELDSSGINTSKISSDYIDIVRNGKDRKGLDLLKSYQQAKQANLQQRNAAKLENPDADKAIMELGSLYSITYSSFREKVAVRSLGRVSAKDYTRGQRTIAGSMNFAVFQSHELMQFLRDPISGSEIVLLDQLPKFNMMMLMTNEYGGASILHIFGMTLSTESQQASVNDLALMNSVTFYAEDIMTIENVGNVFETSLSMLHPSVVAGQSLKFYNRSSSQTLDDLLKPDKGQNTKVAQFLERSRGLF